MMVADATNGGAYVRAVGSGGPPDRAGVTPGSVIVAVDGASVPYASSLNAQVTARRPGQQVSFTWVDGNGLRHTASLTLPTGPAD